MLSLATRSFGAADATIKFQNLANWVNNSGGYVPGLPMASVLFCSMSLILSTNEDIKLLDSWTLLIQHQWFFYSVELNLGSLLAQVSPKLRYIDGTVKGAMLLAAEKIRSGERLLHIPSSLQISDVPRQFSFCTEISGNHLGNNFD